MLTGRKIKQETRCYTSVCVCVCMLVWVKRKRQKQLDSVWKHGKKKNTITKRVSQADQVAVEALFVDVIVQWGYQINQCTQTGITKVTPTRQLQFPIKKMNTLQRFWPVTCCGCTSQYIQITLFKTLREHKLFFFFLIGSRLCSPHRWVSSNPETSRRWLTSVFEQLRGTSWSCSVSVIQSYGLHTPSKTKYMLQYTVAWRTDLVLELKTHLSEK